MGTTVANEWGWKASSQKNWGLNVCLGCQLYHLWGSHLTTGLTRSNVVNSQMSTQVHIHQCMSKDLTYILLDKKTKGNYPKHLEKHNFLQHLKI